VTKQIFILSPDAVAHTLEQASFDMPRLSGLGRYGSMSSPDEMLAGFAVGSGERWWLVSL
jgi:hypothetical protein